jgi:hypothetical protein
MSNTLINILSKSIGDNLSSIPYINKYKEDHLDCNIYVSCNDWYHCPTHSGTNREFEYHKSITPDNVINSINEWLQ